MAKQDHLGHSVSRNSSQREAKGLMISDTSKLLIFKILKLFCNNLDEKSKQNTQKIFIPLLRV